MVELWLGWGFDKKIVPVAVQSPIELRLALISLGDQFKSQSQKFSGSKRNLRLKKFLGHKNFRSQKKIRSKRIGSEFFFVKRNPGRVNPRGRIYDPPPQKIEGLKFGEVVLSCPKRFFVQKKNIGRVNPGR